MDDEETWKFLRGNAIRCFKLDERFGITRSERSDPDRWAGEIELGSALFTLVEPHKGHEVAYNRWYERDHFYAGCMVGPWLYAGRRWVATRDEKALRTGTRPDLFGDGSPGHLPRPLLRLAGKHDEHFDWGLRQVQVAARQRPDGRAPRPHPHVLYDLRLAARVKADLGVPVIAMGRLTPEAAEQALADGHADVIAMGRPLIADPDLPASWPRVAATGFGRAPTSTGASGRSSPTTRCAAASTPTPVTRPRPRRPPATAGSSSSSGPVPPASSAPAGSPSAVPGRGVGAGRRRRRHPAGRRAGRRRPARAGRLARRRGRGRRRHDPARGRGRPDAALAAGATELVWAVGRPWAGLDRVQAWLDAGPPPSVTVLGAGKAAVSTALLAARGGAAVALDSGDATVLAPELGLPGRFRLVADARAAGVVEGGSVPGPVLDLRPGDPLPPPRRSTASPSTSSATPRVPPASATPSPPPTSRRPLT